MRVINVVSLLNGDPILLHGKKGIPVKEELKLALISEPVVTLDFEGYSYFSATFANHLFGAFIMEMDWEAQHLFARVWFHNIENDDLHTIIMCVYSADTRRKKRNIIPPSELD